MDETLPVSRSYFRAIWYTDKISMSICSKTAVEFFSFGDNERLQLFTGLIENLGVSGYEKKRVDLETKTLTSQTITRSPSAISLAVDHILSKRR